MTNRPRRMLGVAILIACLETLANGNTAVWGQKAEPVTATLVPPAVQEVFARNKIKLAKGNAPHPDQTQGGEYTFRVELPYDPQSPQTAVYFNRLYPAILEALGNSAYTLIDVTDAVRIDVRLDKARSKMSVEISNLN